MIKPNKQVIDLKQAKKGIIWSVILNEPKAKSNRKHQLRIVSKNTKAV
ncbi:MAG: hypothetical protein VB009_07205 [Erysipelotrichaceae bacterium]|nr:hypothetical protein [Erysipelotrichaceae bacterium]